MCDAINNDYTSTRAVTLHPQRRVPSQFCVVKNFTGVPLIDCCAFSMPVRWRETLKKSFCTLNERVLKGLRIVCR
jgi:hypothetical protein